ncbi:MAG: hypothetical protein JNN20_03655, partial [Betaproteobacteria bacterium]|nr:hypothetical protein [Betaproteobacteria bacterium]
AALISGALDLAEILLRGLQREKIPTAGRHANLKKQAENLRRLVPIRLSDVYSNQCDKWFQQWRQDRSLDSLRRVASYNELFGQISKDRFKYLNFKAILVFVTTRDAEKALAILLSIKNADAIAPHVRYSIAFLQAFKGQMALAERSYTTAFGLDRGGEVAFEVEEFIAWIAADHPDKPQLHYCLGLINLRGKKDAQLAARDFKRFLALAPEEQFGQQIRTAKNHVAGFASGADAANEDIENLNVIPLRANSSSTSR